MKSKIALVALLASCSQSNVILADQQVAGLAELQDSNSILEQTTHDIENELLSTISTSLFAVAPAFKPMTARTTNLYTDKVLSRTAARPYRAYVHKPQKRGGAILSIGGDHLFTTSDGRRIQMMSVAKDHEADTDNTAALYDYQPETGLIQTIDEKGEPIEVHINELSEDLQKQILDSHKRAEETEFKDCDIDDDSIECQTQLEPWVYVDHPDAVEMELEDDYRERKEKEALESQDKNNVSQDNEQVPAAKEEDKVS